MQNPDEKKKSVAQAALNFVSDDDVLGVGTGSTINYFIKLLAEQRISITSAVASSIQTENLLQQYNIPLTPLNSASHIDLYIDGADECTCHRHLIKGGGGALLREKILAAASNRFICIVDDSKQVAVLGTFPLAVEVLPFARSYVARELVKLGGQPVWREHYLTDNHNEIVDVHNLKLPDPLAMEQRINQIPGVICNGIFALHMPDKILVAGNRGIQEL